MEIIPTIAQMDRLPAPQVLSREQITLILEVGPSVKKFVEDVEAYALKQMLETDTTFEGFKVVEGKSNRKLVNTDELVKTLKADGYQEAAIFRAPEIETLTNLEKLVGKREFTEKYGKFIEKPQGKPTIAPISDKRPALALNSAVDDFADDLK
ncbi:MAG: DUF2800 domain-containing protein [Roseburia sp.]|nr:DUF2800 domain-containing protein [Anaeroplasma bactoclasticum]MCM1195509.1 DUF2800 domain-containing protein [Roseburia sp.]